MDELKASEVHGVFGRILVLDLEESTLIRLEQVLEEAGFDTTTTWDINEALLLLEKKSLDLIVVGDHPPEIDAYAMLCRPQTVARHVPCIVIRSVRSLPAGLKWSTVVANVRGCSSADILERVRRHLCQPEARAARPIARWGPLAANDQSTPVQAKRSHVG